MISAAMVVAFIIGGESESRFEVRSLAEPIQTGAIQSMGADGAVRMAGGKSIRAGDWYSLRRSPGLLPSWPRVPHAEFVNGDRLVGTVVNADGEAVRFRVTFLGSREQVLRFPLSAVRVVWLAPPPDGVDPPWLGANRRRDTIQSRNGDLATGALTGIDPGRSIVQYQVGGKDQRVDLSKVAAIGFNPDLARARRPKGPYYRITLADGSRLSVMTPSFDGAVWTVQTLFKESLAIPANLVLSVDSEQDKVVFLSDMKPARYQYSSFDGENHDWVPNRSVIGRPLQLELTAIGTSTYDRGLALHSPCTISYTLGGKFRRFEALVGLDSGSGLRGDVVLEVLVDGKARELPDGGRLTGTGGARELHLNVAGGREITITIRSGNGGNVQDHVNLAEARLVP